MIIQCRFVFQVATQGKAWLCLCECHLSSQNGHAEGTASYELALACLDRALVASKRAGDWRTTKYAYYLHAHICDCLEKTAERDRSALACLGLARR